MSNYFNSNFNHNARIVTRVDKLGKLRTETCRREEGSILMAASTNQRTDATSLFIDFPGFKGNVCLTGREARSLYRLLRKHYDADGKFAAV